MDPDRQGIMRLFRSIGASEMGAPSFVARARLGVPARLLRWPAPLA